MAVMVVFSMVAYWNDWFTALIYMTGEGRAPLPLVLRNILIASETSASQASMISGGYAELNKLTEMIKFASIIVAAAPPCSSTTAAPSPSPSAWKGTARWERWTPARRSSSVWARRGRMPDPRAIGI